MWCKKQHTDSDQHTDEYKDEAKGHTSVAIVAQASESEPMKSQSGPYGARGNRNGEKGYGKRNEIPGIGSKGGALRLYPRQPKCPPTSGLAAQRLQRGKGLREDVARWSCAG